MPRKEEVVDTGHGKTSSPRLMSTNWILGLYQVNWIMRFKFLSLINMNIILSSMCLFPPFVQILVFFFQRYKHMVRSGSSSFLFIKKYPKRTTNVGYWKPTGPDRDIKRGVTEEVIGTKKTLVFHMGGWLGYPRVTRMYGLPSCQCMLSLPYSSFFYTSN